MSRQHREHVETETAAHLAWLALPPDPAAGDMLAAWGVEWFDAGQIAEMEAEYQKRNHRRTA